MIIPKAKLRQIWLADLQPAEGNEIDAEISRINIYRLKIFLLVGIVLSCIGIVVLYTGTPTASDVIHRWRTYLAITHLTIVMVLALLFITMIFLKRSGHQFSARSPFVLFTAEFILLVTAAIAGIDQLIATSVAPYMMGCLAVSLVLVISPLRSVLVYTVSFIFFIIVQFLLQPDPIVRISNIIQSTSIVGVAAGLGIVLWRGNVVRFIYEQTIQEQKSDLEQSNQDLLRAKAELETANKTKDRFLAIIGHDLRSPIGTVSNTLELINKGELDSEPEEKKRLLRSLELSSQNTLRLVENLLLWARQQSQGLQPNLEPVSLQRVVLQSTDLLQLAADEKHVTLINTIVKEMPLLADYDMLLTVIRNLISNGIKYTKPGGSVQVGAEAAEDAQSITITISDSGIGMNAAVQATLFQIEHCVSTPGTGNERGTGLGLILCKELVEKMQGKLIITSAEGKGTTAAVTLPSAK